MRRLLGNFISVIITTIRFWGRKIFRFKKFRFGVIERFSPNVILELEGKVCFGNKIRMHSGGIIKVRKGAELIVGNEVSFNYGCMIFCRDKIEIQNGVEFGPNVKIYDHDHDYKCEGGIKSKKYLLKEVFIGENSWIGADTVILRGSIIGKNCVIGAGCIVKGVVPDNTVLVQKRDDTMLNK